MTEDLKHLHFTAWFVDDENGPAVMIQQKDGCNDESVMLHPEQLRSICKHFGILADDGEARKTIATLQRRMLALCERIGDLEDYMAKFSDHKHADLSTEMTKLGALADLANEWCADFEPQTQEPVRSTDAPSKRASEAPADQGRATQGNLI